MAFSTKDYIIGWDGQALPARYLAVDTETHMINKDDPADIPKLVVLVAFGRHPDNPAGKGMIVAATDVEAWIEAHIDRIWIFHNASFDFFVLINHLKSEAWRRRLIEKVEKYEIRDTMGLKGLYDIATQGEPKQGGYQGLEAVIPDLGLDEYVDIDKDRDEKYRLNYASIDGEDLNVIFEEDRNWLEYPIRDVKATFIAYQTLGRRIYETLEIDADLVDRWGILTEKIQVASTIALEQIRKRGLAVDSTMAQTVCTGLREQVASRISDLNREISRISDPSFDVQKRDRTGKPVLTKTGSPSFHKRDLFQLVSRDLQTRYPETYQPPLTENGQLKTAAEAWQSYSDHPVLKLFFDIQDKIKQIGLINLHGNVSRVHPRYGYLTKTGRTSCSGPNIQQVPKDDNIRRCYMASEGHVLIACDYAQLELATLAQTCIHMFGQSRMAEVINQGIDPHKYTASSMLGITIEELDAHPDAKECRQKAKAVNFGIPGGLGAATLARISTIQYQAPMTEEEAGKWMDTYCRSTYPEIGRYRESEGISTLFSNNIEIDLSSLGLNGGSMDPTVGMIRRMMHGHHTKSTSGEPYSDRQYEEADSLLSLCRKHTTKREVRPYLTRDAAKEDADRHLFSERIKTITGRIQSKATYCQARNSRFQGLACDGAKLALFGLFKRKIQVVAFIHDEIVIEVPEGSDYRGRRDELMEVMKSCMQEVVPDVEIGVHCNGVMKHWSKEVENEYEVNDAGKGQIIPIY